MNSVDADDLSFVVLGHDSMSNELESRGTMSSYQSSVTGVSAVPQKLDQLIQENYELRATLNKTNLTMKSQFETLTKWQQDVLHAHQSHKEKFFKTRDLVLQLRAENATLKEELSEKGCVVRDLIRKVADLETCNAKLWADNMELTKEKKLFQEEKAIYTQKIIALENSVALKSKETAQILRGDYESLAYSSRPNVTGAASDGNVSADWSYLDTLSISNVPQERSTPALPEQVRQPGKEVFNMKQWEEDIIKKQADKYSEQMEQLKKELEEKDALLSSAMKELRKERDDAAVVKAQMEVYKSDYEDERSAREKLVGEKENLAEELRALKDQLSRIESSGESHRGDATNEGNASVTHNENAPAAAAAVTSAQPDIEDEAIFICPVCSSCFANADQCQRHANYCLDHQINSSG